MKSMVAMVKQFNDLLGIMPDGEVHDLPVRSKYEHLHEEVTEYTKACTSGSKELQLDALVDIVYVAIGVAYEQGFDFAEAFRRVHAANMQKEPSPGTAKSCVKPEGWKPADLSDLC